MTPESSGSRTPRSPRFATSADQQRNVADDIPATEDIKVLEVLEYGTSDESYAFRVNLQPQLPCSLAPRSVVEQLGYQDQIHVIRPGPLSDQTGNKAIHPIELVKLDIIIEAGLERVLEATFLVVESWAHELVLGQDLCDKTSTGYGLQLGPWAFTENKGHYVIHS